MLPKLTVAGLFLLAFILYQPVLHIGLLADDFALLEWAERGEFTPASWPYFRPVAMLSWRAAAVAMTLTVAYVVARALSGRMPSSHPASIDPATLTRSSWGHSPPSRCRFMKAWCGPSPWWPLCGSPCC